MPVNNKRLLFGIRLMAGVVILLGGLTGLGASEPVASIPIALPASAGMSAFQLVAPGSGWVLIGNSLYWTENAGQGWLQLSPPIMSGNEIRAVSFTDPHFGWLISGSPAGTGRADVQIIRTSDGGLTWQTASLALPSDVAALAGDIYLQFLDAHTGWLVVKQNTSSLFSLGTLFKTTDGGQTWQRLPLPAGGPIRFSSAQDGLLESGPPAHEQFATHDGGLTWQRQPPQLSRSELADLSMATPDVGWSKSVTGECEANNCQLVTQLLQTTNGGVTWAAIPLPDGETSLRRNFLAPSSPSTVPDAASASPSLNLVYHGDGFDTCMIGALPSLAEMQTWYSSSPFRVRNLYLGGASLPDCGHLTFDYVQQLAQQGWVFIPTWVGPQPPCASVAHRTSSDPTAAFNEGLIEADLALNAAASLGFTLAGQSGTIIYYDIEFYHPPPPPDDLPCRQAFQAFISGWTARLHSRGSLSGVYGSPCGSYVSDMSAIPNVPDSVWLARWTHTSYDPNVSVFGLNCIDDSLWTNSQRLRQYTGGHHEEWGGVTLNIDSDVVHGPVATVRGNCVPNSNQVALFVYPHYGGACVLKGAGSYATPPSLSLPNDAISSVRVGANVVLRLCQHELYAGVCEVLTADTAQLSGHPVGDNQASSAVVEPVGQTANRRIYMPIFPLIPSFSGVQNGGFENGPANWSTVSALQRPLIVNSGLPQGVTPRTGAWLAWLGGADGETAYLLQTLAVPSAAPYLSYWHRLSSAEASCSFDTVTVWANNNAVNSYGLCASANTNGWVKHVINLTPYAGTSAAIRIQLTTDANLTSSLFMDDLTFQTVP